MSKPKISHLTDRRFTTIKDGIDCWLHVQTFTIQSSLIMRLALKSSYVQTSKKVLLRLISKKNFD